MVRISLGNTTLIYSVTKICKNVGLIAKLRHSLPRPTLLNIYNSLIHPYLTYGLAAWGQACKTYLNKILHLLYFADWHDQAIPLFPEANYFFIMSHDINDDKVSANTLNLFKKTSNLPLFV